MIGDPSAIRALARALTRRAEDIHDLAGRVVDQADAVPWQGLAADAMRAAVQHGAAGLRRTAGLHEDAAAALERHADQVAAAQAAIREAVHGLKRVLGALS
jgi:uncharacterized protein YukE